MSNIYLKWCTSDRIIILEFEWMFKFERYDTNVMKIPKDIERFMLNVYIFILPLRWIQAAIKRISSLAPYTLMIFCDI